jgi:hypothetical protein
MCGGHTCAHMRLVVPLSQGYVYLRACARVRACAYAYAHLPSGTHNVCAYGRLHLSTSHPSIHPSAARPPSPPSVTDPPLPQRTHCLSPRGTRPKVSVLDAVPCAARAPAAPHVWCRVCFCPLHVVCCVLSAACSMSYVASCILMPYRAHHVLPPLHTRAPVTTAVRTTPRPRGLPRRPRLKAELLVVGHDVRRNCSPATSASGLGCVDLHISARDCAAVQRHKLWEARVRFSGVCLVQYSVVTVGTLACKGDAVRLQRKDHDRRDNRKERPA